MKMFFNLSIVCSILSLLLIGCASEEKKSSSATVPPASSEASTAPAETSLPTDMSTAETNSGQTIPLKDLPTKKGYPYAIKTKWKGLVKSPYAQDQKLVNVSKMPPDSFARCPHTGKIFVVPP